MKPTTFHTLWALALSVFTSIQQTTNALEFRPLTLLSEATPQSAVKPATSRTLSDHRVKHDVSGSRPHRPRDEQGNSSRHLSLVGGSENRTALRTLRKVQHAAESSANTTDFKAGVQRKAQHAAGSYAHRTGKVQHAAGSSTNGTDFKAGMQRKVKHAAGSSMNGTDFKAGVRRKVQHAAGSSMNETDFKAGVSKPKEHTAGNSTNGTSFEATVLKPIPVSTLGHGQSDSVSADSLLQVKARAHHKYVSLSPAPAGRMWVVRESSDQQQAPLLSEYMPEAGDRFTGLPGSPFKVVAGSARAESLVVEMISREEWTKEVDEKKIAESASKPFGTRKVQVPPWLPSFAAHVGFLEQAVAKPLNATGDAVIQSAEDSPFILQQVMPIVILVSSIPTSIGQKLSSLAATVANLGLVSAQLLALTIMIGLLLVFLAVDKGFDVAKQRGERNAEKNERDDWWRQLTSWETMPGADIADGRRSDFHLG